MKFKRIYLDVDGVMVNFLRGIHEALDVPYDYFSYPYELGKWNMLTDMGYPFRIVDAVCTEDFWRDLGWMHDGVEIHNAVHMLKNFNRAELFYLTTPMPNPGSWTGKFKWIENYFGKHVAIEQLIVTAVPKHNFANEDSLLIDDNEETVDKFKKAGGYAILVPRPWNRLHPFATGRHSSFTYVVNHKLFYTGENDG